MGGVKAVRLAVDKYKMVTGYKISILKMTRLVLLKSAKKMVVLGGFTLGLFKSPAVTTKLVKHLIADNIRRDPSLKPNQIMSLFKKTYGSNIKYHHGRRGKEAVFEQQFGDDEKSYRNLAWYPRPMIYLDATFLTGRFRGALIAATCVNGNNGFYPYAFALVSAEKKENWFWFLENLKQYNLPIGSCDANSKVVIDLFYKAVYSYTTANFEEALRGMHAIGCGHVANYIRTIPKEKWKNAFFLVCRYTTHSSTLSESFNNWIVDIKKLPAFALLDAIR
ncbi:uncharacterized protein LOC113346821 [Papaver somniferum]|uniref:uncharacterized protein LOC113346821 n=1 Tax=Papaver somniferum TaxID=3469 RepID=UPI000E6FB957|nr:uncharacterized protein LOC113346821 [Papaver somniferum]